MKRSNTGDKGQPARAQTDESLRVERAEADAAVEKKRIVMEKREDDVLRVARERADEVLEVARVDADEATTAPTADATPARSRADVVLERERHRADAVLERERSDRRRYLADFLVTEREATDKDLITERAHADEVVAARDEFLATVSHDLRGMLSALGMNAELLLEGAPESLGDEVRKHAAVNKRLLGRMNTLINDLLDVASIEAGKLACVTEHVELDTLIHETLEAFEPLAASKRVTLSGKAEVVEGPLHAELDAGRILQVLANLVSNALKFTPAGGRISIRVGRAKGGIEFAVSDTGIGISAEALPTVFERFRQVNKARGGLGLGLHISKSIVEAHSGRMWVESTPTKGSTFHFFLPC